MKRDWCNRKHQNGINQRFQGLIKVTEMEK